MKVFLSTTTLRFKEYKDYYYKIRKHLIESGCIITDDWIGKWGEEIAQNPNDRRDIKGIFQKVLKGINSADALIVEFTIPNFSTAHQINYAIARRKPTLVLRLKKDNSFADSYIEAIESPFLTVKTYTRESYKNAIDEFIGYSKLEKGPARYNVVLDKKQKYYLDWAANKNKVSRSKIIREQIDKLIKKDKDYAKYIKH